MTGPLKESELAEVFDRVRTLLQTEISDFQRDSGQGEAAAFIASPVFNPKGLVIGFVALQLNNQHVFRVFTDYNGLGESGEAVVCVRAGEEFTLVAPPRHDPEAVINSGADRRPPRDRNAESRARPARLRRGDRFHGRPVVAAWSYLPSFRWGMVVKQDADEAFALINRQRTAIALLLLSTIAGVTVVGLWLSRTITQPIREAALSHRPRRLR